MAIYFGMFQDDLVASRNLRAYLERCEYPERGYWNLHTFEVNLELCGESPGWYPSNQMGKSATALVFNRETVVRLLGHEKVLSRPQEAGPRKYKSVDGLVVTALKKQGWKEYVHNPSLIQHTGDGVSTLGNGGFPPARSFRGEQFDLLELLKGRTHGSDEP